MGTLLTFLLILFKRKKKSKNFFFPLHLSFLFFCYNFFLYLFLQFSHQNPLNSLLLHLSCREKTNSKRKNKRKRNQEDSTPFLLRTLKNPPRKKSSWPLLFC